jgi:ATP-dependent DNA ligase
MRERCSSYQRARTGYEVKFDGYRCLVGRIPRALRCGQAEVIVSAISSPTVAAACKHLPPDALLDGEIIALDQNGRISFNMLQHHRSQAQAILFYAFDVIIYRGRSLRHVPLETRRGLLSDIAADLKTRTPLIGLSDTLDSTPAELIPLVKEIWLRGHHRQA